MSFRIQNMSVRWLLSAVSLCLLPGTLLADEWAFEVSLDQKKIGTHVFRLENGHLSSRADFNVKVLFINAYRYQHQAEEDWQDGCLQQLQAHTVENREVTDVSGQLQGSQFVVMKQEKRQTLPSCVMTFAYWNPAMLKQSQLLNPQNAEFLDITVSDTGSKRIVVRGEALNASEYHLTGRFQGKSKLNITLWYDQNQRWVGLKSITPEGYVVSYKLI